MAVPRYTSCRQAQVVRCCGLQAHQYRCTMASGSMARVAAYVLLFCIAVLPASDLRCHMRPRISATSSRTTSPADTNMRNHQAPVSPHNIHHSGTLSHPDLAKLHVDTCSATAGSAQRPPVPTALHVRLPSFVQLRWHQLGLTAPQNRESFSHGQASGASSSAAAACCSTMCLLEDVCHLLITYKEPKCTSYLDNPSVARAQACSEPSR